MAVLDTASRSAGYPENTRFTAFAEVK